MHNGHYFFILLREAIGDDLSPMELSVRYGHVWGKYLFILFQKIKQNYRGVLILFAGQSYLRHVIFFHLRREEYYNIIKCRYKHNCFCNFGLAKINYGIMLRKLRNKHLVF